MIPTFVSDDGARRRNGPSCAYNIGAAVCLSVTLFSSQGLGLSTLAKWLRAERRTGVQPPEQNGSVPFQEVHLRPPFRSTGWAAEVAWADGAVLRLSAQADGAWANSRLQALRRPC